jgi:hypothetical protein
VVAAVAAVYLSDQEGEETTVAAVRPGVGGGQRCGGGQRDGDWKTKKKQGRGGSAGGSGQQASHTLTHAEQARVVSGLCFRHFCFGAKATKCEAPCTWSGN